MDRFAEAIDKVIASYKPAEPDRLRKDFNDFVRPALLNAFIEAASDNQEVSKAVDILSLSSLLGELLDNLKKSLDELTNYSKHVTNTVSLFLKDAGVDLLEAYRTASKKLDQTSAFLENVESSFTTTLKDARAATVDTQRIVQQSNQAIAASVEVLRLNAENYLRVDASVGHSINQATRIADDLKILTDNNASFRSWFEYEVGRVKEGTVALNTIIEVLVKNIELKAAISDDHLQMIVDQEKREKRKEVVDISTSVVQGIKDLIDIVKALTPEPEPEVEEEVLYG